MPTTPGPMRLVFADGPFGGRSVIVTDRPDGGPPVRVYASRGENDAVRLAASQTLDAVVYRRIRIDEAGAHYRLAGRAVEVRLHGGPADGHKVWIHPRDATPQILIAVLDGAAHALDDRAALDDDIMRAAYEQWRTYYRTPPEHPHQLHLDYRFDRPPSDLPPRVPGAAWPEPPHASN